MEASKMPLVVDVGEGKETESSSIQMVVTKNITQSSSDISCSPNETTTFPPLPESSDSLACLSDPVSEIDPEMCEQLCANVEIIRRILDDLQPNAQIDDEAAMVVSYLIDDFLLSVGHGCYKLARHRDSQTLQLQDLYTYLGIEWEMPACSLPPLPFDISSSSSSSSVSCSSSATRRYPSSAINDSSKYRHLISMRAAKTRALMNHILEQQTNLLHGDKIHTSRHRVKTSGGKSHLNNTNNVNVANSNSNFPININQPAGTSGGGEEEGAGSSSLNVVDSIDNLRGKGGNNSTKESVDKRSKILLDDGEIGKRGEMKNKPNGAGRERKIVVGEKKEGEKRSAEPKIKMEKKSKI